MTTIAVTGSASGIGAATVRRLADRGHRVIGIDLKDSEVQCDLGTAEGRTNAIERIGELCEGRLDGLVTCAGLAGTSTRPGSDLVSVNYFGTVALLEGLHGTLAAAAQPAVVCLSSNSTTCQPNWPTEVAEACLAGDEPRARALAEEHGGVATYPATKAAIAWYVRTCAPTPEWAGSGIRLNAIAPGFIDTAMTAEVRADPQLGEFVDAFPTPRGNPGAATEIAALAEFLLGDDAGLLHGSVVYADGGTDAMLRAKDWPAVWSV
ncbi:NAD(P)-dependent dehydrogenase (short-subunit alcohol dehydrogenase family) [Halopolyspora algeriensis]|uniref:NAD(P)-dependent dehydrogenase (Short-subunit alcohol dehydrogenase family) n=1 Tax=Halopolyspora algeriensis TaxID=1500506 RepID=A0A368VVA4_9ACTN|nr:SDR family oxidoreductase [Halopolyspora algeriensis]RCW44588.1 NAD(P)-dependent dehydrogenase (short-subunit alcohol dehydrogenase family) [Halopolyspora algeriensis]TQM55948.1 NAD(P)-dependent dehydrogenase (short-subunit alcohol dehydrogenase family) [Halopolyspora algeriensis]